jgi:peptide/nickel transport system ATP-binding protein
VTADAQPLVRVDNLSAEFRRGNTWRRVVSGVDLTISPGEILGLAGESGSGKSTLAYALLGFSRAGGRIADGAVWIGDQEVNRLPARALQEIRGGTIGYVSQHPGAALTRGLRVGTQIRETLRSHGWNDSDLKARTVEVLEAVGIPDPEAAMHKFPYQFSGGQQQRVAIAMALAGAPSLIVLDEPTTGLDVTTTRRVIELLRTVRSHSKVAMLYVTHDLRVLRRLCDRLAVMHQGALVETGNCEDVIARPSHPYTVELISSVPTISRPLEPVVMTRDEADGGDYRRPGGCTFADRCIGAEARCAEPQTMQPVTSGHVVACWKWSQLTDVAAARVADVPVDGGAATNPIESGDPVLTVSSLCCGYDAGRAWRRRSVDVVNDVSFDIGEGETVALVGESGAGKSTVARAVAGLHAPSSGSISWLGEPIAKHRPLSVRQQIQIVFQNPDQSLNPRATVEAVLSRPLELYFGMRGAAAKPRIGELLGDVNLPADYAERFTFQLSGGEKQRVAIARALAAKPSLLVCDEILSSLDVSLQGAILDLLRDLRRDQKLSYLFITHDLAVARWLASRVVVLRDGELCEVGPAESLFADPQHEYTRALLAAASWYDVGASADQDPATPLPTPR